MDRIVIKSNDRELIDAVWSLQIENDRLPDWCARLFQANRLAELTVYLREDDITFALAAALFEFMDACNGGVGFSIRHLQIQSGDVLFIDRTQEPDYELSQFCRRSDFDLTPTERHAYNIPRWIQNR